MLIKILTSFYDARADRTFVPNEIAEVSEELALSFFAAQFAVPLSPPREQATRKPRETRKGR